MSQDKQTVYISKELYDKVKKYLEDQGTFNTVEELIEFMLNELLQQSSGEIMSKEDEEKVKDRLKRLGYM
ncbi:CopG family transcriptional regulator [Caldisphaera sp.]|uniref:CopG family transcriptional regulator n=1 Tax=Caldisphaera sp. TaxID=2060322 RepID=UPI0025BAB1AB|nr:CopG family transcriptional regulator [Caldisphaera sp.]